MKRFFASLFLSAALLFSVSGQQQKSDTTIYMLTCAPGTEIYSLWGHSALRVVINEPASDMVYNWGVFDFNTPNFAWKFAKGRLDYMLGVYSYKTFLQDYYLEGRSVYSQEVNLTAVEKLRLMIILNENNKPENRSYRYDFLYDNCSTRIRDIMKKLIGEKLIMPPDEPGKKTTFRDRIHEYTNVAPWLQMGIDLLVGTPADKRSGFENDMFLPDLLQRNLTETIINRDRKMVPLLKSIETVLDFPPAVHKNNLLTSPVFAFSILFIFIVLLSALLRNKPFINYFDIAIFFIFSLIAIIIVFFSFFTDHVETRLNINIIWFSPFIIICLWWLITGKNRPGWFKVVFWLSLALVPFLVLAPDMVNTAYLPVTLILAFRSAARADFRWNPFSTEFPE